MIDDLTEEAVAELFIEAARLEAERVEPDTSASALNCNGFGAVHQCCPEVPPAQGIRDENQLYEEPVISARSPEAANRLADLILEKNCQRRWGRWARAPEVEVDEEVQNGKAIGLAWIINYPKLSLHSCSVAEVARSVHGEAVLERTETSG